MSTPENADLDGSLCDYCPTNAEENKARAAGAAYGETPCFNCADYSHFDFSGVKAKDKEIHDLKEQVASLQRTLAHNRDRDSVVDG